MWVTYELLSFLFLYLKALEGIVLSMLSWLKHAILVVNM
jgi:hypothetical protein